MTVKDCPKWHELYASYDANVMPGLSNVIDVDGAASSKASASKRQRGRTSSKAEAKHNASSQSAMDIKTFLADKEVSSEKRDERKRRKKKEAVKNYVTIQHKKLTVEEINAHNKRKELELSLLTDETKLMATPLAGRMDPTQREWLEKKMILD
jgi:ribosome-associated protein YbcJ (S4-like RNA binding protein)